MTKKHELQQALTDIADAIRSKTGGVSPLTVPEMAPAIEGIDVHQRGENEPFFAWTGIVVGDRIDGVSSDSKSRFTITLDEPIPDSITPNVAYTGKILSGSYPNYDKGSWDKWIWINSASPASQSTNSDCLMSIEFTAQASSTHANKAMYCYALLFKTYILVEFYFGSSNYNVTLDDVTFPMALAVNLTPKAILDEYNAKIEQDAS